MKNGPDDKDGRNKKESDKKKLQDDLNEAAKEEEEVEFAIDEENEIELSQKVKAEVDEQAELLEAETKEQESKGDFDIPESHFPTTREDRPENPSTSTDDEPEQDNEDTYAPKKPGR